MNMKTAVIHALVLAAIFSPSLVSAWDLPHYRIVAAAAEVLPERARWEEVLGEEYHRIAGDDGKNGYVFLPDEHGLYATAENRQSGGGLPGAGAGSKWIDCFPYDYLMLRSIPAPDFYIHHGPQGSDAKFLHETGALADRVLQALRTETPREACLWAGSLLHWVSDASALAHAAIIGVADGHTYLDRCLNKKQLIDAIIIPGYHPKLLGKDDVAAIAGIRQRTRELLAFTKLRGDKTKPIFQAAKARSSSSVAGVFFLSSGPREEIEQLSMEAAQEGARACADVLHTVLTLGLADGSRGASLGGKVAAAPIPAYAKSSVLVALLDADRLAEGSLKHDALHRAATPFATHTALDGSYRLHNLPPGRYRLLAYKAGSEPELSEPFTLAVADSLTRDVALDAAVPPGNLVWNPSFTLGLLHEGAPDRWLSLKPVDGRRCTVSAPITLEAGSRFRFGIARRESGTQATVIVFDPADKGLIWKGVIRAEGIRKTLGRRFDAGTEEVMLPAMQQGAYAIIELITIQPVEQAVERVWLRPDHATPAPK